MSDAPEYIGVHFEEDHKMHGTWAGPAKGHIYVNILRHQKVIDRAEAAEAKLAKAVTRLQHIAANKITDELTVIEWDTHDTFTILDTCISKARTTLAELEDKTDE